MQTKNKKKMQHKKKLPNDRQLLVSQKISINLLNRTDWFLHLQ